MRPAVFIATLFCTAAAALLVGAVELYEYVEWRLKGQTAQMELADSTKKPTLTVGGYDVHLIDVRYVSHGGELVVARKQLTGDVARRLVSGERIAVTYLRHDPQRVLYAHDERRSPWGWLIAGVVLMATSVYALRLRRKEARDAAA